MGTGLCRVSDIAVGVCSNHRNPKNVTGTVISGSGDTTCDGLPICRLSDIVVFDCGHTGTIIASSTTTNNGLSIGKIGDMVIGDKLFATLVSGSGMTIG